jgi:hypothetical protein
MQMIDFLQRIKAALLCCDVESTIAKVFKLPGGGIGGLRFYTLMKIQRVILGIEKYFKLNL